MSKNRIQSGDSELQEAASIPAWQSLFSAWGFYATFAFAFMAAAIALISGLANKSISALGSERIARVEQENKDLKSKLADRTKPLVDRRLSETERNSLIESLTGSGLKVGLLAPGNDTEVESYFSDFKSISVDAGIFSNQLFGGTVRLGRKRIPPSGLTVFGPPSRERDQLTSAFDLAGIEYNMDEADIRTLFGWPADIVVLGIGTRPGL